MIYLVKGFMDKIVAKIQKLMAEMRPAFERDGGDIGFVGFDAKTGTVEVRLKGMCRGCGFSELTLKMGVEAMLKEYLPEVKKVIAVP